MTDIDTTTRLALGGPDGSAPLLEVRDLGVEFGPRRAPQRAVDGIDLDVVAGRTFALVGESGSGKSITAAAIMGLLPPAARLTSGSVRLQGDELLHDGRPTGVRFRGSRIGMVFQNPMASLDPSFKVGGQLREVIAHHERAVPRSQRAGLAASWLRQVGITDAPRVLASYPHELSGGMRQRVMIALAALAQPALLIADEPTTALDAVVQQQILDLLVSVTQRAGSGMLIITHDFGVVSAVAEEVAVMRAGRIVERGPRREVLGRPRDPYTRSLIASVPEIGTRASLLARGLPRRLGQTAAAITAAPPPPSPAARPNGTAIEPHGTAIELNGTAAGPNGAAAEPAPLVEVVSVSKEFVIGGLGTGQPRRRFLALEDVSLTIGRGELVGLIGESGSGKSTLARLIGGLLPVSQGTIRFDGERIDGRSRAALRPLRSRFQFVFQDATSSLNPRVPAGEQIVRPLVRLGVVRDRRAAGARVADVLDRVRLPADAADRYPHELSGGQRQRIGIARALALEPDLLILDEPTSALDVSTQATILNLLLDLKEELDLTYLFIGHNLALIEFLCDRVGVLEAGRLIETFAATDLVVAARHPVTRRLVEAVLPVHRPGDAA